MKTIQAFKTSDGLIYENKNDAINHENLIALKTLIDNELSYDSAEICYHFIVDNRVKLMKVLNKIK